MNFIRISIVIVFVSYLTSFSLAQFAEVMIGKQVWMSQNLNVETFRNGDIIPHARTFDEWLIASKNAQPAWCYYENDASRGATFGKLYNWYAVSDSRGLAPEGWHVPTLAEWEILHEAVEPKDKRIIEAARSTSEKRFVSPSEIALKSVSGWRNGEDGKNTTGFNAYPTGERSDWEGCRDKDGFIRGNDEAVFWSSTKDKTLLKASRFFITNNIYSSINLENFGKGLAVRCVKNINKLDKATAQSTPSVVTNTQSELEGANQMRSQFGYKIKEAFTVALWQYVLVSESVGEKAVEQVFLDVESNMIHRKLTDADLDVLKEIANEAGTEVTAAVNRTKSSGGTVGSSNTRVTKEGRTCYSCKGSGECSECTRTFKFKIWKKYGGWDEAEETKPGWVKCGGCNSYGEQLEFDSTNNGPRSKSCYNSSCVGGWVKCPKCYGVEKLGKCHSCHGTGKDD